MKDQYKADRRDPVVKHLERQGLIELAAALQIYLTAPTGVQPIAPRGRALVGALLIAITLAPMPALAVKKESIYDGFRRWEHGSYCQSLFSH